MSKLLIVMKFIGTDRSMRTHDSDVTIMCDRESLMVGLKLPHTC